VKSKSTRLINFSRQPAVNCRRSMQAWRLLIPDKEKPATTDIVAGCLGTPD